MLRIITLRLSTVLLAVVVFAQQAYPPPYSQAPQQQQYPAPPDGYPPPPQSSGEEQADQQHGVARVSLLQGDVNLRRGDSSELVAAVVNAPLLARDRLQTSAQSSAEIQLDGFNLIRLAENTDVGMADLGNGRAQLQLGAGTMIFRALRESQAQIEVDTPSIAVRPLGAADLRMSLLENGTTQVTVRAGAAEIYGPRGSQQLSAPRSVLVRGNPADPEFQDTAMPGLDQVDDWSLARDNAMTSASASSQYAGTDMAGVGDLDGNGSWVGSQYGQVWAPRAQEGWSPYSNGQWVDEPYYGWTWVDAAPWGWAPYHYGRWFLNGGRGWCWWPGGLSHHVWGPAYVGFFGWGGGSGLGWVALAPFEGFHAWWGRGGWRGNYGNYGGGFGGRSGILGMYRNAGFRGGAITAGSNSFAGVRGRFSFVSRENLNRATAIQGRLPVSAGAAGSRFSDRQALANPRLAGVAGRQFFRAGSQPSPGSSASPSRSFGNAGIGTGVRRSNGTANSGGWQHFGDPRATGSYRQNFNGSAAGNPRSENGWHQFGQPPAPQANQQVNQQINQPRNYQYAPQSRGSFGGNQQPQRSYRPAPAPAPQMRSFSSPSGGNYRGSAPPKNETNSFGTRGGQSSNGGGSRGGESHGGGSHGGGGGGGHEGRHR